MGQGATTSALFPFALWSFVLVPFALSSHLLYNIKIHYKIAFIGIPDRNLTMKCGIFFWKIRILQFSSVLQSPSCQRDCSIIRGVKKNLICGENYIYSTLNKQGVYPFQQLVTLMTSLVFVPEDEVIDVWMNVIEPFMAKNQDEISEEIY